MSWIVKMKQELDTAGRGSRGAKVPGQKQSWCVQGTEEGHGSERNERIETVGGGGQGDRQGPDGRGRLWGSVTAPH